MSDTHRKKQHIAWLDGLKTMSCVWIFFVHFNMIFRPEQLGEGAALIAHLLFPFQEADMVVYLFCIISGYLASGKRPKVVRELIQMLILRYLRFVLPFLAVGLLIFLLDHSIGLRVPEMGRLLGNQWLAGFYTEPVRVADVLCMGLFFSSRIDPPLWMIPALFAGNSLLFMLSWICRNRYSRLYYQALLLLLAALLWIGYQEQSSAVYCSAACLIGAGMPVLWEQMAGRSRLCCVIFIVAVLQTREGSEWALWYAFLFSLAVPGVMPVRRLLARSVLARQASWSFSLYLLHVPLLVSIALPSYVFLQYLQGGGVAMLTVGACSVVLAVSVSMIWHHLVEAPLGRFLFYVRQRWGLGDRRIL